MKFASVNFSLLLLASILMTPALTSPPASGQQDAGQYGLMEPEPKLLFDKWAAAQNAADGRNLTPRERFKLLSVSRRSTFAAITNALLYTRLTDKAGRSLGYAIDLIEEIEFIAGQEEGKGSDEQFRLYVKLKNGAVNTLDLSREFRQGKDNTVFHKGYPINYRQAGSQPTLQYSIATDRVRADIDVDYRSSGFPAALFNGHLSASNSDVRASGNYPTYLRRWQGLFDWWDDVFPDLAAEFARSKDKAAPPELLPAGHENAPDSEIVSATSNSFFKAWLIDRDVDRAMSYLHSQLSFCSDLEDAPARKSLAARYKLLFLGTLKAANKELKNPRTLEQAIRPVALVTPHIKPIDHAQKNSYTLAVITESDYNHYVCASPQSELTAQGVDSRARSYGKYYVVKFQFALDNGKGGILALIWAKDNGSWRIETFGAATA